jgi:hypothetical protein
VIPVYVAVAALAVAGVVLCALADGLAPGSRDGCAFHVGAAVSGSADFFREEVAPACPGLTVDDARDTLLWDMAFAAFYGSVGTLALRWLWPRAWRINRLRVRLAWLAWLPAIAAGFDVVENCLAWLGLPDTGPLALDDAFAAAAGVAGWWKWMLAVFAALAVVAAVCGAIGNLRVPQPLDVPAVPSIAPPLRNDAGICLSGGGIRAASFSTGALRALDRRKLLRRARWIAAVSGGAYAAGAWFVARGSKSDAGSVRPQPAGERDRLLDPPPGDPSLFQYVRENRRYLATGRGGLAANFIGGALLVAMNVVVLAVLVALVAWPVGRLVSSWAIQPGLRWFDYTVLGDQTLDVPPRLWLPGTFGPATAVVLAGVSLFLWDPARRRVLLAAAFFAGGGLLLGALLVGIPVALTEVPKAWAEIPGDDAIGGAGIVSILTTLGLTGALVKLLVKPVAANARRLGGVLLALLALLLAGKVATDAAYGVGVFAGTLGWYGFALLAFCGFYSAANAQAWSLFRVYYLRLRSTFATTQDPDKRARGAPGHERVYPLSLDDEPDWPEYQGRPGPKLLVCAAAQRNGDTVTGVPALSFTFSDDSIGLRDVGWDETESVVRSIDHVVPAPAYLERLREPRAWGPRLGSVSAAVAMSGAAFTSAMGRHSLGTTNALLAALNVRLGTWMPNPRYVRAGGAARPFKRPRIGYLLKEIFGTYDADDPYVYVSDGGHWENLGLVELVRRRCRFVFCIDASGDAPDSFATLEEARTMARMECGAEIDIDTKPLRKPEEGGLPERAVTIGVIRYHTCGEVGRDGCPIGLLFYGKAMLAKSAPINTLSFSLRDRIYPRYPTYDQFLARDEFDNLVRLGEWIGRSVALEYGRLTDAIASRNGTGLGDSPALVEAYEYFRP